jgi:xylulose-5-phosphate/fructose-6-phosphate phosphoketolase
MSEKATSKGPLSPEQLAKMNAYWRAANYLSVGQIYLKDNPRLAAQAAADALTY